VVEPIDVAQQRALDRDPDGADDDRRQDKRRPITEPEGVQQKPRAERAQHVLRAMGEVDDVEKTEDHRQPKAQHRVKRAVDQPDQELGEHRRRRGDRKVNPIKHRFSTSPLPRLASSSTSGADTALSAQTRRSIA